MEIVLASHNVHKIRELRDLFKALLNNQKHDLVSLLNFPQYKPPSECGATFQESAQMKAEHAAKTFNKWVLADDSGLVVPAVCDPSSPLSKFYAGDDATDSENKKKLMDALQGTSGLDRAAYYECCLVLASPEGIQKTVTGICEGYIVEEERGRHGFGYDAVFAKHDYEKTFAELDETAKNRISHRRKAFEKMALHLESSKPRTSRKTVKA